MNITEKNIGDEVVLIGEHTLSFKDVELTELDNPNYDDSIETWQIYRCLSDYVMIKKTLDGRTRTISFSCLIVEE